GGSIVSLPYRFHSASAASLSDTASMAAICWRAVASSVTCPSRARSRMLVATASLMVELVHMTWSSVPARHTAPVCRSRTTTPRYPGLDRSSAAAASKRRCWSHPHAGHAGALEVTTGAGAAVVGAVGDPVALATAAGAALGLPPQ